MTYKFSRFGLVAIAGCSAMLLASCENKVAQCNKIIGVANKATTEVQKPVKTNQQRLINSGSWQAV